MRAAALLLLVLAPALAPAALADHAFSHRVVVEGRVVDARGLPVPGARPEVALDGARELGPCLEAQRPETGPTGDFEVCRHVHELDGPVLVTARLGDANATVPLDPVTRSAVVKLQLGEASTARDLAGERRFARTLRVEGRVFSLFDAPRDVDGVMVHATPRGNVSVEARLVAPGSPLVVQRGVTDGEGAYALDLPVEAVPEGARVQVESEGDAAAREADARWRRVDVDLVRDLRMAPPPEGGPGSGSGDVPMPGPAWLLALILAVAAARRLAARGGAG